MIQFSVFTPNRLGRLHDLIRLLGAQGVHVLGLMVLDTTDSAIIRVVVDDPDDDAVLACAVAAHAQAIVSGDRHLLDLKI